MPWASVDIPSLALGILRQAVREQHSDAVVDILYGNLEYVDWINDHCAFEAADYSHFSLDTYFDGFGEWVFSALYDVPEWRLAQFEACHTGSPERRRRALVLTFEDDGRVIQVAPQAVNNELLRLPYASGAERKRALTHSLDEERHGADALA